MGNAMKFLRILNKVIASADLGYLMVKVFNQPNKSNDICLVCFSPEIAKRQEVGTHHTSIQKTRNCENAYQIRARNDNPHEPAPPLGGRSLGIYALLDLISADEPQSGHENSVTDNNAGPVPPLTRRLKENDIVGSVRGHPSGHQPPTFYRPVKIHLYLISTSIPTILFHNSHLSMLLKQIGFVNRGMVPWGDFAVCGHVSPGFAPVVLQDRPARRATERQEVDEWRRSLPPRQPVSEFWGRCQECQMNW